MEEQACDVSFEAGSNGPPPATTTFSVGKALFFPSSVLELGWLVGSHEQFDPPIRLVAGPNQVGLQGGLSMVF